MAYDRMTGTNRLGFSGRLLYHCRTSFGTYVVLLLWLIPRFRDSEKTLPKCKICDEGGPPKLRGPVQLPLQDLLRRRHGSRARSRKGGPGRRLRGLT